MQFTFIVATGGYEPWLVFLAATLLILPLRPHPPKQTIKQLGLDYKPLAQYLKDGDFRKVCVLPWVVLVGLDVMARVTLGSLLWHSPPSKPLLNHHNPKTHPTG